MDTQAEPDPGLCLDLMMLYLASRRRSIAMSFAALCADARSEAREFIEERNQTGCIDFPEPHVVDAATAAGSGGTVCTAANALYFPALLTLVGSLHRNSLGSVAQIVVGDLGLTPEQRVYLETLERVRVVDVETTLAFQEWKLPFVLETLRGVGDAVLYLDAGCYVERDLAPWFARIRDEGHLMFLNGPYSDPRHKTRNWTASVVYQHFGLDKEADDTVTAISTLFGIAPQREDLLAELVAVNLPELLRPHPDCIDNRYDQSLFSVWVQHVVKLPLVRFEDELADTRGYGAGDATVTIHRSRSRPGESFGFLRRARVPAEAAAGA